MKRKYFKKILNTVLNILLISIMIYSLFNIGKWFYDNYKNKKVKNNYKNIEEKINNLVEEKTENKEETRLSIKELKVQNEDTVAWLKVNNTNINYPVVKSTDNAYYLNRSFDKSYNSAGWIFMDFRNKLDGTDKNIVIYGHNRRDNSMFGTLDETMNESWYTNGENRIVLLIFEDRIEKYEVFSVYKVLNEEYYITTDFSNQSYKEFLNTIAGRSIYNFNVNLDETKNIITLSTCSNNDKYRTVLHAIKKTN